jgi:hypothetical protein
MSEIWKPIKNYNNYQVSNFGNIRNTKKNTQLKKKVLKMDIIMFH